MRTPSRQLRATLVLTLISGGLLFAPTRSDAARVIDDFTQGAFSSLQGTNTSQFGTTLLQTELDPASVLGGTRLVFVGSLSLATASIETGKGRFHFTANQNYGYFQLDWGSVTPLNADLSAGGNNRFQFELVDTSPNLTAAIFQLRVKSNNTWFNYDFQNDLTSALNGQTFGLLNIPFTKFAGANFTQVQAIELYAARVTAGQHLGIDFFSVVPEPSVMALLGLAPIFARLTRLSRTARTPTI